MKKEDLIQKLFNSGLVINDHKNAFYTYFERLVETEFYNIFIADMADTFKYFQSVQDKELSIIVNMRRPPCKNLGDALSKELGIKCGEFYRDQYAVKNCPPDANYVFIGHCIAKGKSLLSAEIKLAEFNSHIKYGLFFMDMQKWKGNLHNLNIELCATLTKEDLLKAIPQK